jgi:hypothetical protein
VEFFVLRRRREIVGAERGGGQSRRVVEIADGIVGPGVADGHRTMWSEKIAGSLTSAHRVPEENRRPAMSNFSMETRRGKDQRNGESRWSHKLSGPSKVVNESLFLEKQGALAFLNFILVAAAIDWFHQKSSSQKT